MQAWAVLLGRIQKLETLGNWGIGEAGGIVGDCLWVGVKSVSCWRSRTDFSIFIEFPSRPMDEVNSPAMREATVHRVSLAHARLGTTHIIRRGNFEPLGSGSYKKVMFTVYDGFSAFFIPHIVTPFPILPRTSPQK